MSLATFIPEIWSKLLLASLKKSLVYAAPGVVNRDYEGEISEQGDTVTINSISRPTIGTYVKGSTTITPEQLTTAQRKLIVDQSKYFAFEVDDVDKRQAAGDVIPEAIVEAAYGLRDVADQYVVSLYTGVVAANDLGTIAVVAATPTNAYDLVLVPLMVALDDASVPKEGRYVVIPPWFHGRLLRDDRFVRADASGGTEALRNGFIGRASGFDIRMSNNTPNPVGDDNVVLAGFPGAISFAEQINKVEAYRPEDSFSDAVKGLHLYGAKLVRPNGIAIATVSPT
ncbi:MAG: P22 phage major capsid protein family protein [Acidimicrobiia bacterium]|nr:P22 phage major capsid protein family protein [Acidimicrobiia bacterium]